jgi:hypothetical protein
VGRLGSLAEELVDEIVQRLRLLALFCGPLVEIAGSIDLNFSH